MGDQKNPLLSRRLVALCETLADVPDNAEQLWQEAVRDYATTEAPDEELVRALKDRDLATFRKIINDWDRDHRPRPIEDRTILKRAMKAFRKRLKFTKLDDESRLGVGATTKGQASCIVGITPPHEFPPEIWAELARQGRLTDDGKGVYELND